MAGAVKNKEKKRSVGVWEVFPCLRLPNFLFFLALLFLFLNRGLPQLHSIVMMGEEKVGRFCYGGKIVERGKMEIWSIS